MGFSEKPSKMVGDPPRGLHGNSFWNAIRMGNREKQTFGKNFLSEERNAKDHIPNQQHGIYQAYIYIYICGNLPRRKRIFFGAANTGILFCFTSPIWGQVIGYPPPSRYPSHSEVEVLANWVLNRVLSGLFTNNAGMKHGITIGSQLRNSISCRLTGTGHLPCRRGALGAPVPASDGGNICEQTCPWPGTGRNGHRVTPGLDLFGVKKDALMGKSSMIACHIQWKCSWKQLFKIESAKTIVGLNSNHVSHMVVPVEQMTSVICDRHTSGTWVTQARNPWQHERCCTCSSMKGIALNT
jgi:hypothetical protein